jgi:hypothetical protein
MTFVLRSIDEKKRGFSANTRQLSPSIRVFAVRAPNYLPFVPGVVPVSPGDDGFTRFSASFV